MFGLKTPDVTLAQILAALGWAVAQLVAMGVLDDATSQVVLSVGATFVAAAWKIADALIRSNRAKAKATEAAAKLVLDRGV